MNDLYTVWVGGVEINEHLLPKKEAKNLALKYKNDGYDDVCIEQITLPLYYGDDSSRAE